MDLRRRTAKLIIFAVQHFPKMPREIFFNILVLQENESLHNEFNLPRQPG
jgi:hypothetical protein